MNYTLEIVVSRKHREAEEGNGALTVWTVSTNRYYGTHDVDRFTERSYEVTCVG